MTGTLELVVHADGKWTPLPVWADDDPQPWAEGVVDEYARRRGVRCRAQARMVVVQAWAAIVEDVRERREEDGRRVASAVAFVPMGSTQPADLVPMAGDPLVEEVATSSGEALRVRQLLLAPPPARSTLWRRPSPPPSRERGDVTR